MAKVEIALLASSCNVGVDIQRERSHCNVIASISEEDWHAHDHLLCEAQVALLSAAQESTCVCLLGYSHELFLRVEAGFQATLREIQHGSMYWQCPASLIMVTVM